MPSSKVFSGTTFRIIFEINGGLPYTISGSFIDCHVWYLRYFGISIKEKYSTIADNELDDLIRPLLYENPHLGYRSTQANRWNVTWLNIQFECIRSIYLIFLYLLKVAFDNPLALESETKPTLELWGF